MTKFGQNVGNVIKFIRESIRRKTKKPQKQTQNHHLFFHLSVIVNITKTKSFRIIFFSRTNELKIDWIWNKCSDFQMKKKVLNAQECTNIHNKKRDISIKYANGTT